MHPLLAALLQHPAFHAWLRSQARPTDTQPTILNHHRAARAAALLASQGPTDPTMGVHSPVMFPGSPLPGFPAAPPLPPGGPHAIVPPTTGTFQIPNIPLGSPPGPVAL